MACSAATTLRVCLSILSFFIWCCAVALIVIGGYILGSAEFKNTKQLSESTELLVPSVVLIGAGVFLFIVGLLGCVGSLKENKCCLAVFFILLLIILVGEVAAVALSYYFKSDLKQDLGDKMMKMIHDCRNQSAPRSDAECHELDYIQEKLHCCGKSDYKDWLVLNGTIPESCCKNKTDNCTTHYPQNIYSKGCFNDVVTKFESAFEWIFVGTIIVAVLQVLGLVATVVLLCRSKSTPYSHLDSQGYRITD